MIEIKNLTKSFVNPKVGRRFVFKDFSCVIPSGRNVALIGRNGAGKSTLMRMLCGQDVPDSGRIVSDKTVSWPVGLSGGFQGSLTGRENVKFVCRVQGASRDRMREMVREVEAFSDIGEYFDMPVKTYSSGMRGRVAFGLSLVFEFDYYLVDEAISVGDAHFRDKAAKALHDRVGVSNLILVTHGMGQVRTMCDYVIYLKDGKAIPYEDVEEGIAAYQRG
ncbi:ABC transporter ATP-binding protein [Achromobacter kerstersii]|uniref:ABC transporter ATP-binding protein n=1 Tax=Achromobacter kerstersii TaxID=1353890 RepID=UPI0006C6074C|nr:ABC transporter ATP-binding protein [Achromobacter kerstersii]CUI66452.1 Polysialic acid transport ATP-binding protein KpsT [Achromobacter kerstersii]